MEEKRVPKPGEIYKHFKNNLYQIIAVAIHSETGEQMVVYQALYGSFKTYVRPLSMFISKVDHNKYPQVKQEYRFEIFNVEATNNFAASETKVSMEKQIEENEVENNTLQKSAPQFNTPPTFRHTEPDPKSSEVNAILMDFLDADTFEEKLNIIVGKKKQLNDRLINNMAAAIDCSIDDGPLDVRINDLIYNLTTLSRFEFNRFRS